MMIADTCVSVKKIITLGDNVNILYDNGCDK